MPFSCLVYRCVTYHSNKLPVILQEAYLGDKTLKPPDCDLAFIYVVLALNLIDCSGVEYIQIYTADWLSSVSVSVGYLIMTDDWFSEYVYEVVVDKKFLSPDVLEVMQQEPVVLPAWDPMGALA